MKKILFFGLNFLLFFSCSHKVENVERSFYYWKSDGWSLSDREKSAMDSGKVEKLYVKFFEVSNSAELGNYPVSKSNFRSSENYQIVPTVFIRNEVFLKSSTASLDSLASNVDFLIKKRLKENYKFEAAEFQMDCDWTSKSKDKYFYFLRKLKAISKMKLSCTLRLYPFKYRQKMGIPPVDRVTLMCYNLTNPLESHNKNSILDLKELKSYLTVKDKYPIHMDIALPIYSWMQVYQNNKFSRVIYSDLEEISGILKPIKPFWYEVTKDTVVNYDYYLRVGDKIKYEKITSDQISQAITIIKQNVKLDSDITVTLFHLNREQLNNFNNEEVSNFFRAFSK